MRVPRKRFANYKWRWAVYTPTESLNDPPIFLGILRVLRQNEFKAFSSNDVNDALQIVQDETASQMNLVRSAERNIFRNSGQYWKSLGLLQDIKRGQIVLSSFGKRLADGEITKVEFATTIIKTFELPNKNIETNILEWEQNRVAVKPFEVILKILSRLKNEFGNSYAYISPEELINIVIPLAGDDGTLNEYIEAIILFRNKELDLSDWPNCAPNSNDRRMAREFLLFLSNYGFCNISFKGTSMEERYFLSSISAEEVNDLYSIVIEETELERIERIIQSTQIPANIERKRIVREVLDRPNQNKFRRAILQAYKSTCLITGVKIENVLEAAHIKPVKHNGIDHIKNGLCMRADIHTLFDSNHLRIKPTGEIFLSEEARKKENYYSLPNNIVLPEFLDRNQLDWRFKYH